MSNSAPHHHVLLEGLPELDPHAPVDYAYAATVARLHPDHTVHRASALWPYLHPGFRVFPVRTLIEDVRNVTYAQEHIIDTAIEVAATVRENPRALAITLQTAQFAVDLANTLPILDQDSHIESLVPFS